MKPCPICQIFNCQHEKKFFSFGLAKIMLIQRTLNTAVAIFSKLIVFCPTNNEMQIKLGSALEDLQRCRERVGDVKRWYDLKLNS